MKEVPAGGNTGDDKQFEWISPEPKVLVQRLPLISTPAHQEAHLARLGWSNSALNVFPRVESERTEEARTGHYPSQKRVRRRLLPETAAAFHRGGDEEPLARLLDDQLFPEISGSGDQLLRTPSNVDYVLGSITPKRTDWDPEEVLKSHGIDIFGNQEDREEFTNFCEALLVQSRYFLFSHRDMKNLGLILKARVIAGNWLTPVRGNTPCGISRNVRYCESPLWGGNDHHWNRATNNARRRLMLESPFSPEWSSQYFSDRESCDSLYSDSQVSSCYSSPCSSYGPYSQEEWFSYPRAPFKRKRGHGLTVCDALYYDGKRYVSIKAITDGTKYRLVMPKSHRHQKGMPEDVPIFSAVIEE